MPSSVCDRRWILGVVGAAVVAATATACDTSGSPSPSASAPTTSPVAPPPWPLTDLTYHPCSVLGPDEIARFVLEPSGKQATPPRELPSCSWSSIQTGQSGGFTLRFAPATSDLSDLDQRRVRDPLERTITIAGRRAALTPTLRPDGRNGSCSLYASVPSGGSFYLGIAVSGIATGVDWDVCAKTIDVATVIAARLR
ncbi:Protein of unknown function [Nocardia amikacinitolerans]|uniref:DUF3558 domain-containing protein n=1 Tax=Nocardia amikacinitolerans TaxID=756689 RepID=A0A285M1T6_9NOCA|nr:DUF3558 family protein [Nocardia amikacinitolerans]SNY89501.1 Protein of unknown function [Nocardia amikacinitolerans]